MKIMYYLPYSYHIHTGGLEKIAQTIADGLYEYHDIDYKIVASDVRRGNKIFSLQDFPDTLFIPSFDLVYNFPFPKLWKKNFWQQFETIKQYKPDIIITHTRFFVQSFIGGLIAKWLGIKRIHVEHGSGFVTGYPWHIRVCAWLVDWTIGLWIFRQCDEIVTISQMHKDFLKKFTNKDLTIIYNPIDYIPQEKVKNRIPHIGFIGRLVPLKGVDVLIQALSKLQDRERICTIIGNGSEKKKLEYLVQSLGLSDYIAFVGVDDRSNRFHKFDIFVNPSYQEGLPTTVVEALLAKCIVVATDVGGTNEISHKEDLILVQPGNVKSLQVGIEKAFDNLGKSGESYDRVSKKFSLRESIVKYKKAIQI